MDLPRLRSPTKRPAVWLAFLGLTFATVEHGRAETGVLPSEANSANTPPAAARVGSPFLQPDSPPMKAVAVDPEETRVAVTAIPQLEYKPSLVDAVVAGDDALVNSLLDAGVPPGSVAPNGETPLCAALRAGRVDLALLLLMNGADPNTAGLEGQAPIVLASLRRHPQLTRMLLAAGADPNKTFATPHSKALLAMVTDDHLRSEMKQQRNITPLMASSARGDVEAVTLLLQWGAAKNKHTLPNYRYAINMAADQRYLYVMRILLGRNPEKEPHVLITVNLTNQRATLAVDGVKKMETIISTGRRGYGTPPGRYVITNKYKHWVSTLYDVPMPYFMRLNCGAIGLHQGYVTGRPASHGCIRLPSDMAQKFFSVANVGDEVNIDY